MALRSLNHDFIVQEALVLVLNPSNYLHIMVHLQDRCLQRFLYSNHSVNREIVGATHPFADFSLTLTKHQSEILLAQVALLQNLMNSVNDLE